MADVFLNLIDPLEERYVWKDKSEREIEIARRDMVEAFQHHSVDELKGAQRYVVLHRKFSTMPNVADIGDVLARIIAERKTAETRTKQASGVPTSTDTFLEGLQREREDAKAWAREWLQRAPLGQESLRDGWCRDLHNIVWQLRLSRAKAGRPCEFHEIGERDIATHTMRGKELLDSFRAKGRVLSAELERSIVLKTGTVFKDKERAA